MQEQLLDRNVQRFRGGLVFKAPRLLHHSTLGMSVMMTKKKKMNEVQGRLPSRLADPNFVSGTECEIMLAPTVFVLTVTLCLVQGYLVHKNPPPSRTLQ